MFPESNRLNERAGNCILPVICNELRSHAAAVLRSAIAISVLNHELGGDQSNCRSKWVSERQCRHSTDALMRESEFWTPRSDSLSMHLNPRFSPSGHACEFIRLACARARPSAHGRVGCRMRKFDPIQGIHGTGTHWPRALQGMQTADAWLSGQITQAQPLTCSSEFY